ncbi:MAG TPA: sigma 54-interacting transcriptional regulator [Thermoanaerobacterales bacterium]|nr:sigma 54-interacting transcriptional regulator [Thermoanaerobacterales bacterium]
MKGSLTTISYNIKARDEAYAQLNDLFGSEIKIRSLCTTDLNYEAMIDDDLILITAPVVKDMILPYIKKGCKYIIATRNINTKNLKLLFDIPDNTDVLVINNLWENTVEVVEELELIGINHLNFHPYNPQVPFKDMNFNYAITIGEPQLVPKTIPNVIDLGTRLISVKTIVQILLHFNLSKSFDSIVSSRYIRDLVRLSTELNSLARKNEMLLILMEKIISEFGDGIIVTDMNQQILFHNCLAQEILGIDTGMKGLKLEQVMPWFDEFQTSGFKAVNRREIYITNSEMHVQGGYNNRLITLKEMNRIKDIDEEYRKHQKHKGHIAKYTFTDIKYKSLTIDDLIKKAAKIAKTNSAILIIGESGTGKELIAQSIHNASDRKNNPFIAINCAALSESLLESELFGYEEGAFTGARKGGKKGLFEMADRGTVFLDEIGDAPLSIQTKLLRVLQEKEIMRISGEKIIPVDVRVIAATNKDLLELIENGSFRKDLYYRLNVLPLYVPPLRERKDDIEVLLKLFLKKYAARENMKIPELDGDIINILKKYPWPGNIRELENLAEYIITVSPVTENPRHEILKFISKGRSSHDKPLFKNSDIRDEAICILKILYHSKKDKIIIGRGKIREKLKSQGMNLSEQQIKSRMEALKKSGLIQTMVGKGTIISPKGEREILNVLQNT